MNYFKKLVGDRIYLSPKGTSDEELEKFTQWMNDFEVTDDGLIAYYKDTYSEVENNSYVKYKKN